LLRTHIERRKKDLTKKREEKKEKKKVYKKPELTRQGNLRNVGDMTNTSGAG